MPFSRGDVGLVLFPNADLRTAKRRPVIVVQADDLQTNLSQTIVAMISSNMARADHPSRVTVKRTDAEFAQSGLLSDSVVMTDNLATVRDSEIHRTIGRLSDMTEVDRAIRHTLSV